MFNFFLISLCSLAVVNCFVERKDSNICTNSYPSGYELKRQLRNIPIYEYDVSTLNYDLIEEYIFRDYVYNFEKNSGYTREVALRKALNKYINVYNILDKKYKY